MLGVVKKRKELDKLGGENVIQNFKEKCKGLRVEGNRKENSSSTSVMFTEEDKYMDNDDEEMKEDD